MWVKLIVSCVIVQFGCSIGARNAKDYNQEGVGAYAYQDSFGNSIDKRRSLEVKRLRRWLPPLPPLPPLQPLRPLASPPPIGLGIKWLDPRTIFPLPLLLPPHQPLLLPLPFLLPPLPPLLPLLPPLPLLLPSLPRLHTMRVFPYNYENQQLSLNAAQKAFDLTSDVARFHQNFDFSFQPFAVFNGFQGFPEFDRRDGGNSAFAAGIMRPGFKQQIAAINPENPVMPNVNVVNESDDGHSPPMPGFKSVHTSAYSSSVNINGVEKNEKAAETIINDQGKITKYRVHN